MSRPNPNYSPQLSPNCLRESRPYSSTGRPFTPADLKPCPLGSVYESNDRSICFPNIDNTTQDICPNMSKEYSGRAFNPSLDLSRHNMECSRQPLQHKSASQRGRRLNLEYEMARNKEIALGRLRAEQAAACPRPPLQYERQPNAGCKSQMAAGARGREFDLRAEIQRQLAEAESPNVCMKSGRGSINRGRPMDVERVYDYNMPACTPAGRGGRPLDLQRDLTFRRLNLPTPKQHQQRATSCPTPEQYNTHQSTTQRLPRICPRPSQSVSGNPTRSISPSEATTPMHDKSERSLRIAGKFPVSPISRPLRTSVYSVNEESVQSPGYITKTVTTTTTTRTPQQTRIGSMPQKSLNMLTELYETPRHRNQNISNITQDNSRQMDSGYGGTPTRDFAAKIPLKTPRQPLNLTDQTTTNSFLKPNTSLNSSTRGENITQMESMRQDESMGAKAKTFLNKTQTVPPPPPLPPLDTNSTNCRDLQKGYRSVDQSSHYPGPSTFARRSLDQSSYYDNGSYLMEDDCRALPSRTCPTTIHPQSPQYCPTPTNESYYQNATMSADPSQYHKRQTELSGKSYIDLTGDTQYLDDDMDISGQELLPRSACPKRDSSQIQSWRIPSEDLTCTGYETFQSRKPDLSSTMFQTMPTQKCDIMSGDFEATEYRELPSSQAPVCPPCEQPKATPQKSAITMPTDPTSGHVCDTTSYGLSSLFGNGTQMVNEPSSLRECANAKRCGRVQFDSSDKSQVQSPQQKAIRKAEIENLVYDTYCPGIIQETIDGRENFNNYSFNISLRQDPQTASICEVPPSEDPMTLLEAFSMRIEKERTEINKDLKDNATEEEFENSLNTYFSNQNPSDLNRSIKSLLLSEHLLENEEVEKSKGPSLEAEVQKLVTTFPDNNQIKLIAYTGHTKPVTDET